MSLRTVGLALAALCCLASGAAIAEGQEANGGAKAAIEDLLERRSDALLSRDREAFLATVYPQAGEFGRRQALLFERLGGVPLESLSGKVDWNAYGDLARQADIEKYPGSDSVRIPLTVERYRLRGLDRRDVIQDAFFTFVQEDGEWFVGGDDDLSDVGMYSQRNPWDLADVELTEEDGVVAFSSGCRGECDGVDPLLGTVTAAMARVDEYWDRPWNRKVPFFAPGDSGDLAQIIQATFPVENYVAFAFWTGGAGRSEGARIIASPAAFASGSSERTFSILAHELFHIATLPYRGSFMPRFLDEGFAQYVQYDVAGREPTIFDQAVRISGDIDLPADYEFFLGDSAGVQLAYQKSLSAISFLATRWGDDALRRLYRKIGSASALDGTAAHHLNSALQSVIGVDLDAFETAWASSIAVP